MLVFYIAATLIAMLPLSVRTFAQPGRWDPYPICKDCRSPELIAAPGVGFDLTHSYGCVHAMRFLVHLILILMLVLRTAAIRFQNGSVVFVGKVSLFLP